MKKRSIFLLSLLVLIVAMATVSAADSDNNTINDNSGSDVAVDSSSSTTQATDTSTHTDSSVDKTSDTSTTSSQKTDVSQQTTQKVSDKTSENTQTTSDTTTKASSDTSSKVSSDTNTQSTQSTSQSQSDSNTTNENTNTVNEKTVDTNKSISTDDSSQLSGAVFNIDENNIGDLDDIIASTEPGDTLNFEGTFSGVDIIIYSNLTLTSFSSAKFSDTTIYLTAGSDGATVSNLFINNTNTARLDVIMIDEDVNLLTINNNTFIIDTTTQSQGGITLNKNNYTNITNNKISVSAVSNNITYYNDTYNFEGTVATYGVGVFNSSYVTVKNNEIDVTSTNSNGSYTTITGVAVQGSVLYESAVNSVNVTNNKITLNTESNYVYGVTLHYNIETARVEENVIKNTDSSTSYACGVEIADAVKSVYVQLNDINLNTKDVVYGVILSGSGLRDVTNINVDINNITINSYKARAIESLFTNKTSMMFNVIKVTGSYSNGIGLGGSWYNEFDLNNITVNGTIKTDYTGIDEAIPFTTSGIYITNATQYYGYSPITYEGNYNYMERNNILTDGRYSIILYGDSNTVYNNNLTSYGNTGILHGNYSVSNNGKNNSIYSNSRYVGEGFEELDAQSFVITQDNYQDYFEAPTIDEDGNEIANGLSDVVLDGDILDIQGDVTIPYSFNIDKAVNITSTTNDGKIITNGSKVTILESGSNTNITNITLYNTALFTLGACNITMDHFNLTNVNQNGLGGGTGILSLRRNDDGQDSDNITIKNSYFHTEENGGHSTIVSAGASYVNIDNCTVEGVGNVGNLIYLTTYNTTEGTQNGHINITNNRIIGPEQATEFCYAVDISGADIYIANNFINYTGTGIIGQFSNDTLGEATVSNTIIYNNTLVGCGIETSGASLINNTVKDINSKNSGDVINNTVSSTDFVVSGDNITIANNTITADSETLTTTVQEFNLTNSLFIENSIIGSNISFIINGLNNIIENNTIYRISEDLIIYYLDPLIEISANSSNNTVRYNDLCIIDLFHETNVTGDDCVYVNSSATNNIVQDNYGNTSRIIIPTNETNYTYITYNVTSMEELISALDDIKTNGTYSEDTKYVINLLEGDYTVTEAITWGNGTGDVKEVIINGTGQSINGNGFTSTFLTIDNDYSLTLYNLTMTNFPLENRLNNTYNLGNLTIYDCLFDNAGTIGSGVYSTLTINNTNFTQTVITVTYSNVTIKHSNFYDTNETIVPLINNYGSNLIFIKNNVSNITSTYIMYGMFTTTPRRNPSFYIDDNEFSDLHATNTDIFSRTTQAFNYTLRSNTFINGVTFRVSAPQTNSIYITKNNTYINCSIPVTINGIENINITTEDYTNTITLSSNVTYGANVNGQIIVSINGTEYKTFDVVNGEANITIENSALNLADNNIEVKYVSPDNGYENTTATFTITLAEDMIIRIPEGTLYSGDQITLTTQVAVNGSIAKDGYVIFKVNGKTVRDEDGNPIMVEVDENGMASLNYTIPDTYSNEYNITAVYSGSSGIVRTNTTLTTSLKTATITVEPITAKAGQTVTLTAHITDQNGNPVNSGKLIFKLNGKTLKDENGNTLYATINNGLATLVYTIPDNYSAKDYVLSAVYQGTGFERSEANSTLTLTKSTPTIIPDSTVFGTNNTITINQGTESIQIKATIYDPETNAPIDTTTVVTIKINDKTVTQEYISDGQIDMTIYTSSFKNPTYNITVVVGENSQYERTSFNGTLEIVTPNGLATGSSYNGTLLVKED